MNGDDEEESNDDLTRNNSYQFVTRGGQDNGCNMLQFEFYVQTSKEFFYLNALGPSSRAKLNLCRSRFSRE